MLVGRHAERVLVDRLLEDARTSRSGSLILRGEAGIGKSALCRYALGCAHGMTTLETSGIESEGDLAFSGLARLLGPVLDRMSDIPAPQSAALAGALSLGPPVPGDPFTIYAATLSLLASAAEDSPVLAVVDDAQRLDAASAAALMFAARRLDAERVAMLFAARPEDESGFEAPGIAPHHLGGLEHEPAAALLRRDGGRPLHPRVAERLARATGGNPLALLELPAMLSDAQLAGSEPLDDPLPVTEAVEQAFLQQVRALGPTSQRALLVAAAAQSDAVGPVATAAEALGVSFAALEPAEEAGLLVMGEGRLEFRHPLVRSAVYHGAPPGDRRAAHRALAEAPGQDPGARAWHLAAAALSPDEEVAGELEQAAHSARSRGGYVGAAALLELAARLTPSEERRTGRLVEAVGYLIVAGRPEAAGTLVDEAVAAAVDPALRSEAQFLKGQVEMLRGSPRRAHEAMVAAATMLEDLDPFRAAEMMAESAMPCFMEGELQTALATARRAHRLAEGAKEETERRAAVVLGGALVILGMTEEGASYLDRAYDVIPHTELLSSPMVLATINFLTWLERYEQASKLLAQVVSMARSLSAPGPMPLALAYQSELEYRKGNWQAALAGAAESARLADDMGQGGISGFSFITLSRVLAARGQEMECRTELEHGLKLAAEHGSDSMFSYVSATLGFLELGLGKPEAAIPHLEEGRRRLALHGVREPGVLQLAPDLVEAYVRAGRLEEARAALEELEGQVNASRLSWGLATAARCRGLLSGEDGFESDFEEALDAHDRLQSPFERARTELCYGERLRRAKRRPAARERLVAALATFERLGADPWARRARAELRANGDRVERPSAESAEELTPQELQVARAVSEGATNREAAAALFLSPKTIEAHLGRVYRKLGIRSRTELALLFTEQEGAATTPADGAR